MAPAGSKLPGALRLAATLGAGAVTLLLAASCGDGRTSYRDCDEIVRRCRTVCDYWCDGWGCYPMCFDQCWDDCRRYPDRPRPGDEPQPVPPPADAGPGPVPPVDAGGTSGAGDLCAACTSNDDCASGALCILRGGPRGEGDDGGAPAGRGFCGQACSSSACPEGFSCTQLGSSRQCLPISGTCR
ncbi:MAG: hypothetical protein KF894_14180 [Labilithrix sp.]|nr:hypothetical protein [Labilithrix sp.]